MSKTKVIRVCVSPEEKEALEEAAERAGFKLSPWARALLMRETEREGKKREAINERR